VIFTQYYLDCLSQASYLIGDRETGQAVVVDPRRDIAEYLTDAKAAGLSIVGVINTHFHADFLAGHLELAEATDAWIGYGQRAVTDYAVRSLSDGERVSLGDVTLEILETPGHTPESISVLVYEHADDDVAYGVLTGDALFIGDVGRPDLLASVGYTADQLGRELYQTVQHKLMGLPDPVRVFPAHGAGSACGKNLSTELQSTIGQQRALNYACQPMSEADFLAVVTAGQPAAPEYFVYNATLNRRQRPVLDVDFDLVVLSELETETALDRGAQLVDARDVMEFAAGHLAGSVNVPVDGRFAETAGMVLAPDDEIVIIAPEGQEREVATRLARIGFDQVVGYVADPESFLLSHEAAVRHASRLTASQVEHVLASDASVQLVDLRNPGELDEGAIQGAVNIPLAQLRRRIDELDRHAPVLAYCAGGWRSSVGASLLRREGFADVSDLLGGYAAWQVTGVLASA
jgi:hydroxyacylglutathione hydrolase